MDEDDTNTSLASFVSWFKAGGGYLDVESVDFTTFPPSDGGRGLVAIEDIQEGHILFTIPRYLILSARTSQLPSLFGLDEWKRVGLDKGWSGLILCMMWEQGNGPSFKWHEYLSILPDHFDTPMFWNEEDLKELEGTAVAEKIGKDEVEKEYEEKIVPALQRTDLFPPDTWAVKYSLASYHAMGSRILSRSFHVEPWQGISETGAVTSDGELEDEPTSTDTTEESDTEDSTEVAMVPMADMLNARFGNENTKLFHEQDCLKMVATKPIKAGDQIWNTYGDLPNAELLRRYGHVDLLPLPQGDIGNPGDVVEIRADLVMNAVLERQSTPPSELRERIDWWLEEGGDDAIVIESDCEIPSILVSLVCLFLLPTSEWEKTKSKSKPPRANLDAEVVNILMTALRQRLMQYRTSLEADQELMQQANTLNKIQAITVRMGEKRILNKVVDKLENMRGTESRVNKRKRVADGSGKRNKKGSGGMVM